jgi:hypothetical protein
MMFLVGHRRQSNALLQDQQQRSEEGEALMLERLNFTKELGYEIKSDRRRISLSTLTARWSSYVVDGPY